MNEDLGNLGAAFTNYVSGGAIRQTLLEYDQKRDERFFEKTKTTLPKLKQIDFNSGNEPRNLTPIFILGMPRSGTTLLEQIVSAHSEVRGAGELKDLGQLGGMISLGNQSASLEKLL
jgi:hypothetical protein